jgi:hypothetical protein
MLGHTKILTHRDIQVQPKSVSTLKIYGERNEKEKDTKQRKGNDLGGSLG